MCQSLRRQNAVREIDGEGPPFGVQVNMMGCEAFAYVRLEFVGSPCHRHDVVGVGLAAFGSEIPPVEFLYRPHARILVHPVRTAAALEPDPSGQRRALADGVGSVNRKAETVCDFLIVNP